MYERDEYGYIDTRTTEAGIEIGLMPMMFTIAICVNVSRDPMALPYTYRFCYPKKDTDEAIEVYRSWDGLGLPKGNWIKQKGARVDMRNPRLPMDEFEVDSYEPNYENECEVCSQTPTVTAVKNGETLHDWDLCGVCVFGTAKALDPDWWNGIDD